MGRALVLEDPDYPRRLGSLPGAPPVLCVEGDLSCLGPPAVAVVGTRGCTAYGVGVARHLGTALAAAGVTVVSGLARGIDGHAHRGALQSGRTVAVFGHGLAHTAPSSHRRLRDEILAKGGLVVAGFADAYGPQQWTFPARNPWISGLSDAVVVVEAPLRSGALLTAAAAADQGRDVWAVPGPLRAEASAGCLALLCAGAGVVTDVDDLVAELTNSQPPQRPAWMTRLFAGDALDLVARVASMSTSELIAELGLRELSGEVVRLPGQRYGPGERLR